MKLYFAQVKPYFFAKDGHTKIKRNSDYYSGGKLL